MKWNDYIDSGADVLCGKPVIKNTRLSVDFILDLLSNGWTEEQLLTNYPVLSKESLYAVFSYSLELVREEKLYNLPKVINS